MADTTRIIRQWLETDAAFGVADVPLAVSAAKVAPQRASPPTRPAAATAVTEFVDRVRAAAPAAAPVAKPPPRAAAPQNAFIPGVAPAPAVKKKAGALPATPAGLISALPPLTRSQKERALADLLRELEGASELFINDISTRVVFGEGDPDASLLFVGEGPGIEEDRSGRPFVGRSGQLLDKMIAAIGYTRAQTYIANVVKLRAADWDEKASRLTDRPPNPEEVARGLPFLHRQIEIIHPKVLVTLGAPAVKYLTGTTQGVMSIRGTWLSYRGVPVMPTYHPAFVLRSYTEENRRKVWNDLQMAQKKIQSG